MPVKIDGKTFASHAAAVAWVRKHRPKVKDPHAYVAEIERTQRSRLRH